MKRNMNITELQTVLWETLEDLRNDKATPAQARAVAGVAGRILDSVQLQMDYCQLTRHIRPLSMLEKSE